MEFQRIETFGGMKSIHVAKLLLLLFCIGCKDIGVKRPAALQPNVINSDRFHLSPIVDSLFREFSDSVKAESYALFIDKKSELGRYVLTFAPFDRKTAFNESGTSQFFYVKDTIPVFLYTGAEDILSSEDPSYDSSREIPFELLHGEFRYLRNYMRRIDYTKSWTYVFNNGISEDSMYVIKNVVGIPFFEATMVLPTVKFTVPE